MPRRALADHRPFLLLSIAAAAAYYFLAGDPVAGLPLAIVKGSAVGALAAYALRRAGHRGGRALSAYLALCAVADAVGEFSYLYAGTTIGLACLVMIVFLLRNRRPGLQGSQMAAAAAVVVLVPTIVALLTTPVPNWQWATAYALLLAGMAGAAWISRFPRYRVGIGALLFAVSNVLLVAQAAGRLPPGSSEWFSWPVGYIGQLLLAIGIVQTLRRSV